MNEMRLIVVAEIKASLSPFFLGYLKHMLHGGLKSHDAGERLGTDADMAIKNAAQLARADAVD